MTSVSSKKETTTTTTLENTTHLIETNLISSSSSSSPAISASSSVSSASLPPSDAGVNLDELHNKLLDDDEDDDDEVESDEYESSDSRVPTSLCNQDFKKPSRSVTTSNSTQDDSTKSLAVKSDSTSVRVAVRIRPQSIKERVEMCKICTNVTPNEPQITLGNKDDKSFTFDYVYDLDSRQESIFDSSVKYLVDGCLDGYNATVLAYGQTGSGKTYTMGTSFETCLTSDEEGILPRAIAYLFERIEHNFTLNASNEIVVNAQFIELYNEEIIDLLDGLAGANTNKQLSQFNNNNNQGDLIHEFNSIKTKIEIHEDQYGGIFINGCSTVNVQSIQETLNILKHGAKIRSTGATNMNLQSSRSHAIFTLNIKQRHLIINSEDNDYQTLTAKFHFVDLAGSERLKRTGATGNRAKEGICINRGLLALGNVISALGDREKIGCHVPYRDSKLTRLLQDSLGGNSRTLMIACVSPSDRDFMETLNTLRYANRARNIKNKVIVNQDKTSQQIAQLKAEIERLNLELMQYKSKSSTSNNNCNNNNTTSLMSRTASSATIVNSVNGSATNEITNSTTTTSTSATNESPVEYLFTVNKLRQENIMLLAENQNLRQRTKALTETLEKTKQRNCDLEFTNQTLVSQLNKNGIIPNIQNEAEEEEAPLSSLEEKLKDYIKQIEDLKCKLAESEIQCKLLRQNQLPLTTSGQMICSTESLGLEKNLALDALDEDLLNNTNITTSCSIKKDDESHQLESSSSALVTDDLELDDSTTNSNNPSTNQQQQKLQAEINTLGFEIDLKKRLIGELETNNKNLEKMKSYYEDKLTQLQNRIKQVEDERDKIITHIHESNSVSGADDQIRKIRVEYELKLQSLQADMQKYQQIKAKNAEMLKQAHENERNLQQLNRELLEMKKLKVKLMNQLRDESTKYKKEEQNRMREIATLKRDHLKKDSQIKFLEAEKRCKEIVLKRKQEQLQALRRSNAARLSDKASGRNMQSSTNNLFSTSSTTTGTNNNFSTNGSSSNANNVKANGYSLKNSTDITSIFKKKGLFSRSFHIKWQKLDQIINGIIVKKQTISLIEREMERFLEQREKISRKLNRLINRLDRKLLIQDQLPDEQSKLDELRERIDVMKSNIDYLQDQIGECQTNIIQLDELKDGNDYLNLENFIETITSINEAKYFLKKLLVLGLNKGIVAAQKEHLCNELKCELEQYERDYNTQQQLLQNIINSSSSSTKLNNKNSNDEDDDELTVSNRQQFLNSFNTYFNNQLNGHDPNNSNNSNEPNSYNNENFEIDEIILAPQFEDSTTESEEEEEIFIRKYKNSTKPTDMTDMSNQLTSSFSQQTSSDTSVKARQLITNGPQDLLYCSKTNLDKIFSSSRANLKNLTTSNSKVDSSIINNAALNTLANQVSRICSRSYTKIPEVVNGTIHIDPLNDTSDSKSNSNNTNSTMTTSSIATKSSTNNLNNINNIPMSKSVIVTSSDNANYKRMTRSSMSRQNSKDSFVSTSPSRSPVNYSSSRRLVSKNDNVFNRLTSETKQSPMPERGIIKTYSGNTNRFRSSPLTLTHVAEGHSKAILSIDSHDFKLYTGSKDRTAKIWDLITGQEVAALNEHNNNVIKIKYCRNSHLCFTATSSYVKVWDLRESTTKCIKYLSPTGLVYDGNISINVLNKTKMLPSENQDLNLNDLAIDEFGNYLYLAAGNSIKIWDLKQFSEIAKLSGGHNSSIMTMLIKDNQLITGSKDHYIRVFELSSSFNLFHSYSSSIHSNNSSSINSDSSNNTSSNDVNSLLNGVTVSKFNMMPPHYDGVQTLCRFDGYLFSGSRDMCIKKWSMTDHQCKQSINNAHKDWICSLDYFSEYNNAYTLLSGCRGGYLKMWHSDTLEKIADFRAHLCPINSIKVNNNMLFTASDDATVRIWRKDK